MSQCSREYQEHALSTIRKEVGLSVICMIVAAVCPCFCKPWKPAGRKEVEGNMTGCVHENKLSEYAGGGEQAARGGDR